MEDCGQEQWDKALQTQLADEFGEQNEFSMRDINLAHEQLMNASKVNLKKNNLIKFSSKPENNWIQL